MSMFFRAPILATLALFAATATLPACMGGAEAGGDGTGAAGGGGPAGMHAVPATDGGWGPISRSYSTDALIYDGTAAAYHDADSLASILEERGWTYRRVSSEELNRMSVDELATYGTIVWPGGYAAQMSRSLTSQTRARLREAVRERGVNYMGICAGAWMAIGPSPKPGEGAEWGLSLVEGPIMELYTPSGIDGIEMTPVTVAGYKQPQDIVWWGGPALIEWKGGVIARYKDGVPAMTQAWAGHGFVVLASPHPEAPRIWRDQNGLNDSDGLDLNLAFELIQAARDQRPMATL